MTTGSEANPPSETRWKCVCAYDGGHFKGWQSQPGGQTVQDTIEAALEETFKRPIRIHACSRTDTGVHARGLVFHFDAVWRPAPMYLESALRRRLPRTIKIAPITAASSDFHSRFSAIGKQYRYYIFEGHADPFSVNYCWSHPRPLDTEAMAAAAKVLQGRHDFTSFAAYAGREVETPVRDLQTLTVQRDGPQIIITAEADGFLYKMVRSLVGALVSVGTGKLSPGKIRTILEKRKRTNLVVTAPPHGLFLEHVLYPKEKRDAHA